MKNIPSKNQVMQEAIQVTSEMRASYPELYKFLDETPLFFSNRDDSKICTADFKKYLETLKEQLRNHIQTRPHNLCNYYEAPVFHFSEEV